MKLSMFILGLAALASGPATAQTRRAPAPTVSQAPAVQPKPAPVPTGTPMPVRATARALLGICNENQGACLTYVMGAVDSYVGTSIVNFGRAYVCIPPQVTNQQIANVAVAYLRTHPQMLDVNAALVVVQGISASYPCR
jgi:hypothetical protein